MNIDKKIEDLRKEFNNKLDELKEEYKKEEYKKEKSKKWTPEYGEEYFFLNVGLEINSNINYFYKDDMGIFEYNKIFKTYEEAQEYADYLKARCEYSYEFSKEELKDIKKEKYYIYYDYSEEKLEVFYCYYYGRLNQIYFKTEAQAQAFIDKYKKQILKFEFGIEE